MEQNETEECIHSVEVAQAIQATQPVALAGAPATQPPTTGHSRRSFLKSGSIGAAAVGIALTPGLFGSSATASAAPAAAAPAAAGPLPDGPLTAYVKDHTTGDIAVIVGEHEVVYRDRDLAARLARIATHARPA